MPRGNPKTHVPLHPPTEGTIREQVALTLRMYRTMHQFYADWAKREHRSMQNQIASVLEDAANAELARREHGGDVKYMPPPVRHDEEKSRT